MSANRWSMCPNCKAKRAETAEKLRQRARDGYGVLSQEDYLHELREADKIESKLLPDTLREDWEIGLDGLGVRVDYRAYCERCGFKRKFRHPSGEGDT